MTNNPGLGLLAALPVELRLQIWNRLPLDRDEIEDGANPPRQKLAILYTSGQINREASAIVYVNIDLQFSIHPDYDRKSWLRVSTNLGTDYALQDINDAMHRGFDKLPYEKLRGIHFDIKAPNRRDPAQVFCLFKKCTDLVTLLQSAKRALPDMALRLSDSTPDAKWTVDGAPQKSVACDRPRSFPIVDKIIDRQDDQAFIYCDDSQIVLCAFLPLRNVRSAQIFLPNDMERQEPFLNSLEDVWTDEGPFGTYLDPDYGWNDTKLQERLDLIFTDLDLELDMLPGETANMLRLERFAAWYTDEAGGKSPYERDYERIIKSWTDRKYTRDTRAEKLNWRYGMMRALNPRSLYYQYTKPRVSSWGLNFSMPENDPSKKKALVESGLVSKVWDRDVWFREYGNGIPALRSKDKWGLLQIFSRYDSDVLPKQEYDMKEKLSGWVVDDTDDSQENVSDALVERSTEVPKSESSDSDEDEEDDDDSEDDDDDDEDQPFPLPLCDCCSHICTPIRRIKSG